MHESESEVTESCLTLSDPMDCSLPGSPAHGVLQAKVLEWGAIALSDTSTTDKQRLTIQYSLLYKPFNLFD